MYVTGDPVVRYFLMGSVVVFVLPAIWSFRTQSLLSEPLGRLIARLRERFGLQKF